MSSHFTFFESYYTAVKDLDSEIKAEFYDVIFEYALYDQEPKESSNPVVKALFKMAQPNLDNSKAKRNAGKQGGSKAKQTTSKAKQTTSKAKQNGSKAKQNGSKAKQTVSDKEKEKDKESNKAKAFKAPTLQQVIEYQAEKCNLVNPQYFYDFFTSSNWIDSNGKQVLNWKQKMISWQKAEAGKIANNPNHTQQRREDVGFLI